MTHRLRYCRRIDGGAIFPAAPDRRSDHRRIFAQVAQIKRKAPTTSGAALGGTAPEPQVGTSSDLISKLLGIGANSTSGWGRGPFASFFLACAFGAFGATRASSTATENSSSKHRSDSFRPITLWVSRSGLPLAGLEFRGWLPAQMQHIRLFCVA